MQFKEPRVATEYQELPNKNPKLLTLLNDIEKYSLDAFNKEPMVTRIFCTKEEEDALYVDNMAARPKVSPHEVWEAADLRSIIYTDDQINKLVNYVNSRYKYHTGLHPVALYHKISGNAFHFHFQYV